MVWQEFEPAAENNFIVSINYYCFFGDRSTPVKPSHVILDHIGKRKKRLGRGGEVVSD